MGLTITVGNVINRKRISSTLKASGYPPFNLFFISYNKIVAILATVRQRLFLVQYAMLVHRFVNNCTNHVGCGFECAGLKTQA